MTATLGAPVATGPPPAPEDKPTTAGLRAQSEALTKRLAATDVLLTIGTGAELRRALQRQKQALVVERHECLKEIAAAQRAYLNRRPAAAVKVKVEEVESSPRAAMTTPHEELGLGREFADTYLFFDSTRNVLDSLHAPEKEERNEAKKQQRITGTLDTVDCEIEMSADNTRQSSESTAIAERRAPAAPAAQDAALMLQMRKAQCCAQTSAAALEMQKLAAHLEQQIEELTTWLDANRTVERLKVLVPLKEHRLAACLAQLATLNGAL